MISVQIAISQLSRVGLTDYLSERSEPRLIIRYKGCRSLAILEGFISERALNSVLHQCLVA